MSLGDAFARCLIPPTIKNKPDIGASKFREWADQKGLNVLLGGANTGVSIAMSKVAASKKVVFISIGAGGASLTNEDCTAFSVHYVYDTTALASGTATTIVKNGGKTWFYLTADYAFGTQHETRAFRRREFERIKKQPTMTQAGTYSATLTYLKAVRTAGTTDADRVMAELKKMKINDMFTKGGYIRADGLMVHDMYVMQVKSPQESNYPWDYYKVVKVMSGEQAFGPLTGRCPLAPK
jgi:ABC-type branched-subunit amino acid transport system substrate-binding protein